MKRDRDLRPADYGDATAEDVARALLLHRPKRKQADGKTGKKIREEKRSDEG